MASVVRFQNIEFETSLLRNFNREERVYGI
jgi:hypothetical protein